MPYNGFYDKLVIDAYRNKLPVRPGLKNDTYVKLGKQPENKDEPFGDYLERYTMKFKLDHQYARPDDIAYFRANLGNHTAVIAPLPAVLTRTLCPHFNDHIKGDEAGKGWHTESTHPAVAGGQWSYAAWTWIAQTKGTYSATAVQIKGTAKAGNGGVSAFFPSAMSIDEIRSEAEYVANTCHASQVGQLIVGVGRKTGIRIECLMTGTTITSAYPHIE